MTAAAAAPATDVRSFCRGTPPLTARLEPWMAELLADPAAVDGLVPEGSPANVHDAAPFARNVAELRSAAAGRGVELGVFFARKADKALAYVREARRVGAGVDVAGLEELRQTLAEGVGRVIVTAAVKTAALVDESVAAGATLSIDNADELARVRAAADRQGRRALAALRLSGFEHGGRTLPSRFGFDVGECLEAAGSLGRRVRLDGLHFHLDGYDAAQRASAAHACLDLVPALREAGHPAAFLDIGGGVPMSYLDSAAEWAAFWEAVDDRPEEVTFDGTRYRRGDGRSCYPYHQSPTRAAWLEGLLDMPDAEGRGLAGRLRDLSVELRCEPGRSVLDGCGMTLARVEFRKACPTSLHPLGGTLVGLAMNRTQCRTTSEDFLVDPLLVPCGGGRTAPTAGFLVGSYCMESEVLTKRRLEFPRGVGLGDVAAFPNTAGYLMHFLESRSHQFPLAPNLVRGAGWAADAVDAL